MLWELQTGIAAELRSSSTLITLSASGRRKSPGLERHITLLQRHRAGWCNTANRHTPPSSTESMLNQTQTSAYCIKIPLFVKHISSHAVKCVKRINSAQNQCNSVLLKFRIERVQNKKMEERRATIKQSICFYRLF